MNYFKEQLEQFIPIIDLSKFKGKSIYGEYRVGDIALYFFELREDGSLELKSIVDREIDKFLTEYTYCSGEKTPVFLKNI